MQATLLKRLGDAIEPRVERKTSEIILPEAEPALERIMERALQKVNVRRSHALVRAAFLMHFYPWAHARGEVGIEWRFRLGMPNETRSPLVPDLAYVSHRRAARLKDAELESPCIAPNLAVYAHSTDEPSEYREDKVQRFLMNGTDLVLFLNVTERVITAQAQSGRRTYKYEDRFAHEAAPALEMQVRDVFNILKRPHITYKI